MNLVFPMMNNDRCQCDLKFNYFIPKLVDIYKKKEPTFVNDDNNGNIIIVVEGEDES